MRLPDASVCGCCGFSVESALDQTGAWSLEEIIRSLAEGKPAESSETVIAMLQARIGRMEPGPRWAVCAAAVFGPTFWRGGVATLLELPPTSLELDSWLSVLEKEEMVQPHPTSHIKGDQEFGFRHSLVRDAAYHLLTERDLLTAHRLAAEFLAAVKEPDSTATPSPGAQRHGEALAYHYQQAQMFDKARDALMRTGEAMVLLGASSEARTRYTAALAMIEKVPDTEDNRRCKIDVLLRLVQTGMLLATHEEHARRLLQARELLSTLDGAADASAADRLRWARLNYLYGHLYYYRGQTPEAISYYRQVLPVAQEFGAQELLAVPAYMLGVALAVRGYTRQAEPMLAQAIPPLLRYGDPMEWLRALLFYGHALMAKGQYHEGLAHMDRGHARAIELNNPEFLLMSYIVRCSFFRTCGNWPETIRCTDKALALAEQLSNPTYVWVASSYYAWAQSYLGNPEGAAAARGRALAIAGAQQKPMLLSRWFAAADCEIALNAGRYAETIAGAQAILPKLQAEDEFLAAQVTARALAVAMAVHAPCDSEVRLADCLRAFLDTGNVMEAARTHLWWSWLGLQRGDLDLAQHHVELARQQFLSSGCTYAYAEAQQLAERIAAGRRAG